MKVFISHSSKDGEVANRLSDLIKKACMNVNVFCSSDKGAIPQGSNYIEYIFSNLKDCSVFIPLITQNYYESKFCMIELGIATSKLMTEYLDQGVSYIFPFSLYPVKKSMALANTPLVHIQTSDLQDEDNMRAFLKEYFTLNIHSDLKSLVEKFEYELTQIVMADQNIVGNANNVFTCFDTSNLTIRDNEDFFKCCIDEQERITVNYNLDPYEAGNSVRPSFASLVIQYIDGLNLLAYLKHMQKAELYFEFRSFTNSIRRISLELKYGDSHIILMHPFTFEVHQGKQHFTVPLFELESEKLNQITEICFVVHESEFVEIEGSFMIENIKVR